MIDFVDSHKDQFGVEPVCAQLPIASSTYYAAPPALGKICDQGLGHLLDLGKRHIEAGHPNGALLFPNDDMSVACSFWRKRRDRHAQSTSHRSTLDAVLRKVLREEAAPSAMDDHFAAAIDYVVALDSESRLA